MTATLPWPHTARLAHAFDAAGAKVEALAPQSHPLAHCRYLRKLHPHRPLAPLTGLRRAIAGAAPGLIVPCDDRALGQLLALYDAAKSDDPSIAQRIAFSLGAAENYPLLTARSRFLALARQEGIVVPETRATDDAREFADALDRLGLPLVVKSDGSWGGNGTVIAQSPEEAWRAFHRFADARTRLHDIARAMRRKDPYFLHRALAGRRKPAGTSAQAFVAGTNATSSFACWQGEVIAALHFDVVCARGATGPASVVRRVECGQMQAAAVKLARRFALSGLHGLDFIRDAGGQVHLLEINPRTTPTSHLALGPGQDPCGELAAAAFGRPLAPRAAATAGDTIALFPQEWLRDAHSPYLQSAYHDMPWDDPGAMRASLGPRQRGEARSALPARPLRAPHLLMRD